MLELVCEPLPNDTQLGLFLMLSVSHGLSGSVQAAAGNGLLRRCLLCSLGECLLSIQLLLSRWKDHCQVWSTWGYWWSQDAWDEQEKNSLGICSALEMTSAPWTAHRGPIVAIKPVPLNSDPPVAQMQFWLCKGTYHRLKCSCTERRVTYVLVVLHHTCLSSWISMRPRMLVMATCEAQ